MMQIPRSFLFPALVAVAVSAAGIHATANPARRQPPPFEYRSETWYDARFHVVRADPTRTHVRMYWRNARGRNYGGQTALDTALRAQGETLLAASNAGIFTRRAPEGLHVERGQVLTPLNLGNGSGDFYQKPNAVFFVTAAGRAEIVESTAAQTRIRDMAEATQSGPALLLNGRLVGPFTQSTTTSMRNGTKAGRNGVCVDGRSVYLVRTPDAITRAHLALFFRDRLGCRDGLYLDGATPSSLYVPGRYNGSKRGLRGILAVVARN